MENMILFISLIITISVLYIVFMVFGSYILIKIGSMVTKVNEIEVAKKYFKRRKYMK